MHVFVTGASGFIGSAVVPHLIEAGHRVTGMVRSDAAAEHLAALGAQAHRGELTEPEGIAAAVTEVDGVIHLGFRHGVDMVDAVHSDQQVIDAIGAELAGSDRPFVVTSGTLVLSSGRLGTEEDRADPDGPGAVRGAAERTALALADHGVRVSVVRLAPSVHERVRRGFAGGLVDAARRAGVSRYLGDGRQRWPTVHRQNAANLFRLALERAPAGAILHGVGEEGVALGAIAELIGERLDLPVQQVGPDEAAERFGWLATLVATDAPASSAATRRLLDWTPTHPGLLDDMADSTADGEFFGPVPE